MVFLPSKRVAKRRELFMRVYFAISGTISRNFYVVQAGSFHTLGSNNEWFKRVY